MCELDGENIPKAVMAKWQCCLYDDHPVAIQNPLTRKPTVAISDDADGR
jgi:hypothetical protein